MKDPPALPDRYQPLKLIGTGLGSEVYQVRDTTTGKIIALKLSTAGHATDEVERAADMSQREEGALQGSGTLQGSGALQGSGFQFQREFYFLSRFNHPGIVPVYDFGFAPDGRPYFTMEYVDGVPITRAFAGFTQKLFTVVAQVCQALQSIHNQGLVHCDLKPENILVRKSRPEAVILDFGFAEETVRAGISGAGGTIGYIAPEVFKGAGVDARADLYSLGLVLYETVARRKPFGDKSPITLLKTQYSSELPSLRTLNPKVPEPFDRLVRSLIQNDPQARPSSAFEVIEALPATGSRPAEPPKGFILSSGFVGRKALLDEVKALEQKICLDRHPVPEGGVVLITGDQGVGKSRFLKEFKFQVQLDRTAVIAYDPLAEGEKTGSLVAWLASRVLGRETPPAGPENGKYELFERLVNGLAARAPLVLLIDDLPLLDPLGLEFFRYLAFGAAHLDLFIVATGRPDSGPVDLVRSLALKPHVRHLILPPLTAADTTRLALSLLGPVDKPDRFGAWLYERTGGNSLFVYETVRALIDQSMIRRRVGRWLVGEEKLAGYQPAPRIQEQISARLAALGPDEQRLLAWACAVGRSFEPRLLPAAPGAHFATIESLVAKGFLNTVFTGGRLEYHFANTTIKQLVDASLKGAERKKIFLEVARTLETIGGQPPDGELVFEVANAYREAGVPAKTYAAALAAARRANLFSLLPEALSFYRTSLALADRFGTVEEKAGILEAIGYLEYLSGHFPAALDAYDALVRLLTTAGRPDRLPRIFRQQGTVLHLLGRTDPAIESLRTGLDLLAGPASLESARIASSMAWTFNTLGRHDEAERTFTGALATARALDDRTTTAEILHGLCATARHQGQFDRAVEFGEQSKRLLAGRDAPYLLATVNNSLGTIYGERGELAKARDCYEQAFAFLKKAASPYYLIRTLEGLGLIESEQNRWAEARTYFEEAIDWAEKIDDQAALAQARVNLGSTLVELGDWPRAQELYEECLANRKTRDAAAVLDNLVNLAILRGDRAAAERYLGRAAKIPADPFVLAADRARIELVDRNYPRAAAAAAEALERARDGNNPARLRLANLLWAELELGRNNLPSAAGHADAVLALEPVPPKERALALRFAGSARSGLGEPAGPELLRQSVDLFRSLGARYELARSLAETARRSLVPPETDPDRLSAAFRAAEEAETILTGLGADAAQVKADKIELARRMLDARPGDLGRREYLRIFSELSELINLGLTKEDFLERILDLVIGITGAERGLLFLLEDGELRLVAGRRIDHLTVEDAKNISRSIIRRVEQAQEPVFCADALADPRFDSTQSVRLNRIRSILCAPLRTPAGVIGTIYLDSRITNNLFLEEEKDFLLAVSNLLAATIDKSLAFKKLQDEVSLLRDEVVVDAATGYFLGKSSAVRQIYAEVGKIAPTDCTVLILGATGSGKGILARLIHNRSSRRDNKFVSVNCGTLPETLFESELFGHSKGAFTGATRDRQGILEAAAGGTVFLDEITNTSAAIQAKLLELLDDKTIRRLGEDESRRVDVRLICATNRDLQEDIAAGRFREDLYYRLSVVTMRVPALRERQEDIPLLAQYFVERYALQLNKRITGFTPEVRALFVRYPWPGNVRELQNTIERATIMAEGKKIGAADLKLHIAPGETPPVAFRDDVKSFERKRVVEALKKTQGNISRAAKLLSIHRRQLQRFIRNYQIKKDDFG